MTGNKEPRKRFMALTVLVGVFALLFTTLGITAPASATGDDNKDCPEGYFYIAKANWTGGGYVFEGDANGVTIDGDTTSGTFTSVTPVSALVVKASTDDKVIYYRPAVTSGSFDNSGLMTPSGQTPAISHVTFCGVEEEPPPTIKECPETLGTVVVTPSNLQGFTFTETRATGHYKFLENGLRIWTEGATSTDKVAGYKAVNVPLIDVGDPSLTFDNTSGGGIPGSQLVIDFDGNGTTDGILVGEDVYGDDWWLTNSSAQFVKDGAPNTGGGSGSEWFGTLNEWLASYPDAVVKAFGFSLGSGVKGDGIINKITFNCTEYVFTTDPEVEPEQGTATATSEGCVEPGKSNGTVTITVYNTDDETNDDETYSVTFNNGDAATLVIPDGQSAQKIISNVAAGSYPVKVTGTDGTNLSLTVTVAECEEPPVEPEGNLNVSSTCESITFSSDGVKPEDADQVFKLDGVVMAPGTHPVTAGSHTVELFVNGELVDSETITVAKCEDEVEPEGSIDASADCLVITIGEPTGVKPADADVLITLDGEQVQPGQYTVEAGEHVIKLFVNEELVDTVKVEAKTCEEPPPPTPVTPTEPTPTDVCEPASGSTNDRITIPSDANFTYQVDGKDVVAGAFVATGTSHVVKAIAKQDVVVKDGAKTEWTYTFTKVACVTTTPPPPVVVPPVVTPPVVTPPVVTPPVPTPTPTPEPEPKKVKGAVKVLDKCESNNFFKVKKVKGLHYVVKGKIVREGKWLKSATKRLVVKVVADSDKSVVKGKKKFVFVYANTASCSPVIVEPPHTGLP